MSKPAKGPGRGNHNLRGKTHEIRTWLIANPGEALPYDDLALRFALTRRQVEAICKCLRDEGTAMSATMVFLNTNRLREP